MQTIQKLEAVSKDDEIKSKEIEKLMKQIEDKNSEIIK